jgi:plasmid stability protein
MANITIKNIPDELYEMLKQQAKINHRSINSEIIFTLKRVLGFRDRAEMDEILRQAREFRKKIRVTLSEDDINEAKRSGRE